MAPSPQQGPLTASMAPSPQQGPGLTLRSVYQEQYSAPGRVKRTELRPTSAHRRNNPQPKTDFLFPLSLMSSRAQRPLEVDRSRTTLPPIRPPLGPPPGVSYGPGSTEEKGTQLNMPPLRLRTPPDRVLHSTTTTAWNTAGSKANRSLSDAVLQGRPHTTLPRQRALSLGSVDHSGCCSCFHRVKPFQSGHYTIHPEFVSEMIY